MYEIQISIMYKDGKFYKLPLRITVLREILVLATLVRLQQRQQNNSLFNGRLVQLARTSALHAGGHGFESHSVHH